MPAVLFDSSLYIRAFRRGEASPALRLHLPGDVVVWLSAVVLEELYAGASAKDLDFLGEMESEFRGANQMVVPDLEDWVLAGRILARVAAKYGFEEIGRGRLTNDALIAGSAGRHGITVFTENRRDFARIAEFYPFPCEIA